MGREPNTSEIETALGLLALIGIISVISGLLVVCFILQRVEAAPIETDPHVIENRIDYLESEAEKMGDDLDRLEGVWDVEPLLSTTPGVD